MSSGLIVAFVVVCVALVSGQSASEGGVSLNGDCPLWTPQQNVEVSRLVGNWIGLYSQMHGINRAQPRCVRSNIQVAANGEVNSTLNMIRNNNVRFVKSSVGSAVDGQSGRIRFTSIEHPEKTLTTTVLSTDYDHYSVMVNCKSDGNHHGYSVVILSRQPTLSPQLLLNAKAAITAANIDEQVQPIDQTNCN